MGLCPGKGYSQVRYDFEGNEEEKRQIKPALLLREIEE